MTCSNLATPAMGKIPSEKSSPLRGLVDDTGSYIHLMRIDKRTNELVYEEKTEKGTGEKIEESPEK